jgi:DNA-binding response OmpR family regulator
VLRRTQWINPAMPVATPLVVGDLRIDVAAHTVHVSGRTLTLSPLEFRLLHVLAREANQVISAANLLHRVWGDAYEGESQILYVYIRELRTKLETDPHRPVRIVTVHGVGYKLVPQE